MEKIREDFERPMGFDLVTDKTHSPIYRIKLEAMKDDVPSQPRMTSSKSTDSADSSVDQESTYTLAMIESRDDYF